MGKVTIYTLARKLKQIGIDVPHPQLDTIHHAEELETDLPCSSCLSYDCEFCNQFIAVQYAREAPLLTAYLVSKYSYIRLLAKVRFEEFMDL